MAMERTDDRLEEIARNFMTYGDLTFHQYCSKIDAVTSADINSVATRLLAGKPTMLVTGGAINMVSSAANVSEAVNRGLLAAELTLPDDDIGEVMSAALRRGQSAALGSKKQLGGRKRRWYLGIQSKKDPGHVRCVIGRLFWFKYLF